MTQGTKPNNRALMDKQKEASKMTLKEIKKLYETSIQDRQMILGQYSEIAKYTMPYVDVWDNNTKSITKQSNIIDSTILNSWKDMNSFIMSTMFSSGGWADLEIDKEMYNDLKASSDKVASILGKDYDELMTKLSKDGKKTFRYLLNSNYMAVVSKALSEAQNLGTGCIKMIENIGTSAVTRPFKFKHIPISRVSFCEDVYGNPSHTFITHKAMPKDDIKVLFKKAPKGKKENYDIVEANVLEAENDVWHKTVYVMGTDEVVYSDKLSYNDTVVFRWDTSQHSVYGTGLGFELIDDFKRLEKYKQLQRASAELNVYPPLGFTGSIEVMNKLNYKMGSVNFLGENAEIGAVNPLNVASNYLSLEQEIQRAENNIRNAYISNPIGDYTDRNVTTATEIQQRMSIFRQRMSGVYEALSNELLKASYLSAFKLLSTKMTFEFDMELYSLIKLKYVNQLSKSADMDTAQRVINFKTMAKELFPDEEKFVISSVNSLTGLGELMDIPQDYYASQESAKKNVEKYQENMLSQPTQPETAPQGGTI